MKRFASTVTIHAPAAVIWAILTDASAYPQWNSTVLRIAGTIALGARITVHAKLAPGRAFPVKVAVFEPAKRMVWQGGMPLGLFVGTRIFTLTQQTPDTVAFAMQETFTGLLAPLISRSIPDLQPAFETFAADLKLAAERTT